MKIINKKERQTDNNRLLWPDFHFFFWISNWIQIAWQLAPSETWWDSNHVHERMFGLWEMNAQTNCVLMLAWSMDMLAPWATKSVSIIDYHNGYTTYIVNLISITFCMMVSKKQKPNFIYFFRLEIWSLSGLRSFFANDIFQENISKKNVSNDKLKNFDVTKY